MFCQRYWRRRHEREQQMADWDTAEMIRESIRNLNLFGDDHGGGAANNNPHGMTPEDRKLFLKNMLVTKKIIKIIVHHESVIDFSSDGSVDLEEDATPALEDDTLAPPKSVSMLLCDSQDKRNTVKHTTTEPCPICLTEYEEGDKICWSQSSQCTHMFHRKCIFEWLMKHNDCPLCRNDFLTLAEDGFELSSPRRISSEEVASTSVGSSDTQRAQIQQLSSRHEDPEAPQLNGLFRGLQMFYLLSQLQDMIEGGEESPNMRYVVPPPTTQSSDLEMVEGPTTTMSPLQDNEEVDEVDVDVEEGSSTIEPVTGDEQNTTPEDSPPPTNEADDPGEQPLAAESPSEKADVR